MDDDMDIELFAKKGRKKRGKKPKQADASTAIAHQADDAPDAVIEVARDSDGNLSAEELPYQKPCTLEALSAAASGGFVGALYGFGSKLVFHKGKGRLAAGRGEALSSAKAFASFGGIYALSSCVVKRLRNTDDIVTTATAGAATGFVMGINGGLQSALASAAMMCGFSIFLDKMGAQEAVAAAQQPVIRAARGSQQGRAARRGELGLGRQADWATCLLCLALPLPARSLCRQQSRKFRPLRDDT